MHYRAPERPPPFATGFMAAVEASCGTDGRCRSASTCPTTWASTPLVHRAHGLARLKSSALVPRPLCSRGACSVASQSICAPSRRWCRQGAFSRCSRAEARPFRAAWQPTSSSCNLSRARHTGYVPSHCPRRVTASVHLQPIYRLSCSIRRSSAPAPRPPSPPWLSARLRSSPSPPPALFTIILCSLALSSCSRGSLKGGMERQGGGQGGCFRAAAQQQSSHGSDGPPARFQQLRRRFSARLRVLRVSCTHSPLVACRKKMCTCAR